MVLVCVAYLSNCSHQDKNNIHHKHRKHHTEIASSVWGMTDKAVTGHHLSNQGWTGKKIIVTV